MELEEHKTMVKGTLWGMAGSLLLKIISFVYFILIAHFFSQEDIGTFYLALSIVGVLGIFADLGISFAFQRFIPYYLGKGEKTKAFALLKGAYILVIGLSLTITLLVLAAADNISKFYQNEQLGLSLYVMALNFVINSVFLLNTYAFVSFKRMREQTISFNAQNFLKLALTSVLLFALGSNVLALSWGFVLATLGAAIWSLRALWKVIKDEGMHGSIGMGEIFEIIKEIIPFGIIISIISSMWVIVSSTDRIMLGYMLDPEKAASEIAVYSFAVTLAWMVILFTGVTSTIFLPIISELHAKGKKNEMERLSSFAVRWTMILMAPTAIIFLIFPGELLDMMYGSEYAAGKTVMVLFAIAGFVRGASLIHSSIFAALRMLKVELKIAVIAALVNVALNLVLIPAYGIDGAAFASAAALMLVSVLFFYYSKKILGYVFLRGMVKPILAGLIVCAALFLVREPIAASLYVAAPRINELSGIWNSAYVKVFKLAYISVLFALICAAYFCALAALRGFEAEDKKMITSAFRRIGMKETHIEFLTQALSLSL